ncbi:hypothetical protein NM962_12590 [Mycobacterium sp. SVM_VP21]|nr:hypothetical protein NM962_12590 [Mycobacterium sp. SVM_VP21]
MSGLKVIQLDDGRTVTAQDVRELLPVVTPDRLEVVHGRVSTGRFAHKRAVIGEISGGRLVVSQFLPAKGWQEIRPGCWHHKFVDRRTYSAEYRAACRWIEGAPRLYWAAQ